MYSKGLNLQSKNRMQRNITVQSSRIASERITLAPRFSLIQLSFFQLIATDGGFDVR
jgi:hypothetical protein